MKTKICPGCKKDLPVSEFGLRTINGKKYPNSRCRPCFALWQKEYRVQNPDKYKYNNNKAVMKKMGFTPESFKIESDKQDGKCLICLKPPAQNKRLHIDHDHSCCPPARACNKCFRGLLCQSCNGALGLVSDNIDTLLAMIEYLKSWKSREIPLHSTAE